MRMPPQRSKADANMVIAMAKKVNSFLDIQLEAVFIPQARKQAQALYDRMRAG